MLSRELRDEIDRDFPCRGKELHVLDALLHINVDRSDRDALRIRPPGILIYGASQSGKTLIVQSLLEASDEHNYTYIDCRKCTSSRLFFEYTIDEILDEELLVDDDGNLRHDSVSIDNLGSFLAVLEKTLSGQKHDDSVLVFDHISTRLFEGCHAIIQSITALLERLPGAHTAVFVVSYYDDIPAFPMPSIHFQPYKVDELCLILQQDVPKTIDLETNNIADESDLKILWDRFCKTLLSAFFETVGHDIDLYRIIAHQIFPSYLAPIRDNILSVKNHVQLARSAAPILADEKWILAECTLSSKTGMQSTRSDGLSTASRYLLLAAFLASYNPEKTDRTYFSHGKGEKTKRRGGKSAVNSVTKQSQKLLGPKGFTLDRMYSILQAIMPTEFKHTALLDQQIATLVSLKLILKQGASSDLLEDGKWVVNVNLETIMKVARSVEFEMNRYLVSD